jgi:ATP-binding cassette subfamily F protein uup
LGEIAPDTGKFDIGQTVRFGYFAQETPAVETDKRVIDVVRDVAEYIDLGGGQHLTASQLLQHFLFTPEQQYNYVYKLSGGERRKLYLCTVLMRQPNFLVLDEPTNDLDIPTLQVLEQYLEDFPGCVIIVSHDRYFTDKLVDHILVCHGDGQITDFPGNYTQYRQWKKLAPAEVTTDKGKTTEKRNAPVKQETQKSESRRLTYGERLEMQSLEKEIESLEQQQRQIENELSNTSLTVEQLTEKSMLFASLKQQCEEKTNRWLELSERE